MAVDQDRRPVPNHRSTWGEPQIYYSELYWHQVYNSFKQELPELRDAQFSWTWGSAVSRGASVWNRDWNTLERFSPERYMAYSEGHYTEEDADVQQAHYSSLALDSKALVDLFEKTGQRKSAELLRAEYGHLFTNVGEDRICSQPQL